MTLRLVAAVVLALVSANDAAATQGSAAPATKGPAALPPVGGSSPPLLSTVPDPQAGARAEPAQMSGVPLQVGDLPPGFVAVRVIRRSFQDNVAGQVVRLRAGDGRRVMTATTGSDGRAQFEGLRVGDNIQVRAAVGNENLESNQFQVPAQGGVRLVLVAGVGAPTATGADWPEASGDEAAVPSPAGLPNAPPARATPSAPAPPRTGLWLWLAGAMGLASAAVVFELRRRRPKPEAPAPEERDAGAVEAAPPPAHAEPSERRAEAFERLVRLEQDYEAGRMTETVHASARDALIEELATFDAADQP